MNEKNTKYLFEKYPKIFAGKDEDIRINLIPFGFECGDGWFTLIDTLCEQLQWDTDKNNYPQIKAVQVKEKYGQLRFYVNGANDNQYGAIDFAETISSHICENCGNPGRIYDFNWLYTRCEKCAKKEFFDKGTVELFEDECP